MTRYQAYMLNFQVNSFLATYCFQNWMQLNHDDGLFIFRSMGNEAAKCKGSSIKFGPGGRSDNNQFEPFPRTTRSDLQEAPDWDGHKYSLRKMLEAHEYSLKIS
ncbi:hypothetical protein PVAP13_6KG191018 [Panicum virgatum]|uniref:Uncharacterized protein n=1 Tax=Panicum virgatum TaxID=38727 RepID=A0A8T0RB35_PANVG|nr:hypothetical protein PVAP13_6KG191018 [Panicum virgatum]